MQNIPYAAFEGFTAESLGNVSCRYGTDGIFGINASQIAHIVCKNIHQKKKRRQIINWLYFIATPSICRLGTFVYFEYGSHLL